MSVKTLVLIGMTVGSIVGSYIPSLLGFDIFSLVSILGSGIGGILGIFIAYKLTRDL